MKRIAIANPKGGVGKTTTAVNLAAALAETGARVLLVDVDPLAQASLCFGARDDEGGLLDALLGRREPEDLVRETGAKRVDLIPSSLRIRRAEPEIAGRRAGVLLLRRALDRLPDDRWEYLIADSPPSLGPLAQSVLAAVDQLLIPVEANPLAIEGLEALLASAAGVRQYANPDLTIAGILPCQIRPQTKVGRSMLEALRRRFGDIVLATEIRQDVRLAEVPGAGQPVTLFAPQSRGAESYRAVADELRARVAPLEGAPRTW